MIATDSNSPLWLRLPPPVAGATAIPKEPNLDSLPLADACALLTAIAARVGEAAQTLAELCGCLPLALTLAGGALAEQEDLAVSDYLRRL